MRTPPWLGCLFVVAACQAAPDVPPSRGPETPDDAGPRTGYPGTLRPPSAFGPDFQWQQHVVAHFRERANPFDAVLSKSGDQMLLIGLGPMKNPGFVVTLEAGSDGPTVSFENRTGRSVPFDPDYIMLDVQRVYFSWIPGSPPQSGERAHRRDGELIVERWADGHLIRRKFVREDGQPPGEIVVRYRGWQDGQMAPRKVELDNGWFGYRLEIETLVQQRL